MNRDILGIVASKLDDESLQRFWMHAGHRDDLREMLRSNLFWYARSEHLAARVLQVRDEADWKTIYYILLAIESEQQEEVTSVHIHALDYYEGMLVVEEIYGPICIDRTFFSTRDVRLLERFVNEASVDLHTFYWHIFECQLRANQGTSVGSELMRHANSPALEYLMSIVPIGLKQTDMYGILRAALEVERVDLLPFIVKYTSQVSNPWRLLQLVATKDYIAGWECVLQYYQPGDNELIACIGECDSINIFTEFYRRDGEVRLSESELDCILDRAIECESTKIIDELTRQTVVDWKRRLVACVVDEPAHLFHRQKYASVCLSKIESEIDLYALLKRVEDRDVAQAILQDYRIRVENLSVTEAVRLYKLVDTYTVKAVAKSNEDTIESYLASDDTYSIVLRYLLFKSRVRSMERVTNCTREDVGRSAAMEAMLDWMIEARLDGLAEAAACALNPSLVWKEDVAPLRALFISLLYPKLLFISIIGLLKTEGYSERQISKSMTLLNLTV